MASMHPHPNPLPQAGEGAGAPDNSLSRARERAGVRVARALRRSSTDAEALLWSKLRARQLGGLKFRRQHPLEGYVLDFACIEARLAVEIDGGQHAQCDAVQRDDLRTQVIGSCGLRVLRFWNNEVLSNLEGVLQVIAEAAQPHPNPLPPAGEGAESTGA